MKKVPLRYPEFPTGGADCAGGGAGCAGSGEGSGSCADASRTSETLARARGTATVGTERRCTAIPFGGAVPPGFRWDGPSVVGCSRAAWRSEVSLHDATFLGADDLDDARVVHDHF